MSKRCEYYFINCSFKSGRMVNFSNTCELAYMYCVQGACKRPVVSSLHVRDYTLTHCWRGSSFSLAASCCCRILLVRLVRTMRRGVLTKATSPKTLDRKRKLNPDSPQATHTHASRVQVEPHGVQSSVLLCT